jgi:DNA-binding NarL/FixJ family response regulator
MTLYLVDDSPLLRERLLSQISEIAGIDMLGWASKADDATQAIQLLRPDVVVLDLQLEQGSGIDVLEAIRKRNLPTSVIIFTCFSSSQYGKLCLEKGADFFLSKTQENDQIETILRKLLHQSAPAA